MRRGSHILLRLMLPVLAVLFMATVVNMWALYQMRQQQAAGVEDKLRSVATLNESSRVSADLIALQQRVDELLRKADQGIWEEATVYREHSQIVDELAAIHRRVQTLVQDSLS